MEKALPAIPAKRYFTIGEVSELCGVKPYVLRYWEQEFGQLKPMKRRGNRRYYQHHEVLLIRRIRELLYEEGFTINGARNRLAEAGMRGAASVIVMPSGSKADKDEAADADDIRAWSGEPQLEAAAAVATTAAVRSVPLTGQPTLAAMREELLSIRSLLGP